MKELEFNNEIIDGQSTVAENLAKSNRNFMLLKEILGSGASSQDIQNMLNTISQTYVKTADVVNSLNSTDTNKPVSALQAKNLKEDMTGLTNQLQQLNQNVSSLTQNVSNLSEQLNQKISSLTQQLDNKVEKLISLPHNTDFNTITEIGDYCIIVGGVNAPVSFESTTATHWNIRVSWGITASNVLYQEAYTFKVPNKIFKRYCVNGGFGSWVTFTGTV